MAKSPNKLVSVIIPVADDSVGLENTLSSLKNQVHDQIEIMVGNDGSGREISLICDKYKVREIGTRRVIGPYAMRNLLVKKSRGSILAFIDAATVASENWITHGVTSLKRADIASGEVRLASQSESDAVELFQVLSAFDVASYISNLHFAPTTNLWTTRAFFGQVGEFDSRLKSSGDYEWGNRAHHMKLKLRYIPRLRVIHPLRTKEELVKKQIRVATGHVDLARYYPERFGSLGTGLLKTTLALALPPVWITKKPKWQGLDRAQKVRVLLIAWQMHLVYNLTKLNGFSRYLLRRR